MSTTPTAAGTLPVAEQTDLHREEPSRKKRLFGGGALVKIVLALVCLLWSVPTIGLLVTSFRSGDDATANGWWTVLWAPFRTEWTLGNYEEVIVEGGMGAAFVNSLVVAIPATIIPILVAAMAAYGFTFLRFPGRTFLFVVVVALLVVPIQVAFIPLLQFYGDVGLTGTFLAVWLAHTGFGMPLAIYILRNYMATLPLSIIESAKVDGASHFTTFWRLVLPMSTPALAAFAIFQFLWVWNDLLIALIFLGVGENAVVTSRLANLIGQYGQRWHLLTAGAFVSMVVPLIVFLVLQRFFVRGLTAGSVKG